MTTINSIKKKLANWETSARKRWATGKKLTSAQTDRLDFIGWDIEELSCEAIEAGDEAKNDRIVSELEELHYDLQSMLWDETETIKEEMEG